MERQLRKYIDALRISAYGLVLLGVWALIKIVLYNLFAAGYTRNLLHISAEGAAYLQPVLVIWVIYAAAGCGVRYYVYKHAKRECFSDAGRLYPAILLVICALQAVSAISYCIPFIRELQTVYLTETLSGIIENLVGAANALAVYIYAARVRKLRKQVEETVTNAA